MTDYDSYPVIEMTRAELMELEDRSACVGPDRPIGHRFRADYNHLLSGPSRWVVGTFCVDEKHKAMCLKATADGFADWSNPRLWTVTGHQRVVITDGPAPKTNLAAQLARMLRLESRGGNKP